MIFKVMGTCLWYITNLPLWLLQKPSTQGSYTYKINDRMGQWLPMNNIVVLANWIITSVLATCTSATCVPSMHQMEAVVVGHFYVNLFTQMCTDYSTPVVSLLLGQHYRATRRVFGEKYSSLSLFVRWYLLWENPAAFQSLQLCSSPRCEQKCIVWPCSKLL